MKYFSIFFVLLILMFGMCFLSTDSSPPELAQCVPTSGYIEGVAVTSPFLGVDLYAYNDVNMLHVEVNYVNSADNAYNVTNFTEIDISGHFVLTWISNDKTVSSGLYLYKKDINIITDAIIVVRAIDPEPLSFVMRC